MGFLSGFFRPFTLFFQKFVLSSSKLPQSSSLKETAKLAAPLDGTLNSGQFFCDGLAGGGIVDLKQLLGEGIFSGALVNLNSGGEGGGGGGGGGGGSAPSSGGEGPGGNQSWAQFAATNQMMANSAKLHTQSSGR